ncbi:hypothetical protein DOJK_00167 [Patescibacteria group bacterium]|nr:hypothetical protein DOJK_00167 [Patescibacteria group bacterium]
MNNKLIASDIRQEINRRLSDIETQYQVNILFACESGSRAWGFASEDSDYDVRFIYSQPTDWYLSVDLEDKRDVIELPIDDVWDINGWELRKALKLFNKSNPPLLEWLQSPIIYRENSLIMSQIRELLTVHYAPTACLYHYLHMASKNYRGYLQGEDVRLKKYFYVLRPLLACRWIERDLGAVPVEFSKLLEATDIPVEIQEIIHQLLQTKMQGGELNQGKRIPALNEFIEAELNRFKSFQANWKKTKTDMNALNQVFQLALQNA